MSHLGRASLFRSPWTCSCTTLAGIMLSGNLQPHMRGVSMLCRLHMNVHASCSCTDMDEAEYAPCSCSWACPCNFGCKLLNVVRSALPRKQKGTVLVFALTEHSCYAHPRLQGTVYTVECLPTCPTAHMTCCTNDMLLWSVGVYVISAAKKLTSMHRSLCRCTARSIHCSAHLDPRLRFR